MQKFKKVMIFEKKLKLEEDEGLEKSATNVNAIKLLYEYDKVLKLKWLWTL